MVLRHYRCSAPEHWGERDKAKKLREKLTTNKDKRAQNRKLMVVKGLGESDSEDGSDEEGDADADGMPPMPPAGGASEGSSRICCGSVGGRMSSSYV